MSLFIYRNKENAKKCFQIKLQQPWTGITKTLKNDVVVCCRPNFSNIAKVVVFFFKNYIKKIQQLNSVVVIFS